MCEFASFIITVNAEYWGPTDSHSDIIERHALIEDGARGPNVVRVEITPPPGARTAPIDQWIYEVDQDILPDWHEADPGATEERARAALTRRASEERWLICETGQMLTGGYGATLTGGYGATLTGGDYATLTGGVYATLTGGQGATLTGGACATLAGGDCATLTGGHGATLTGGDYATLTGGNRATLTGGDCATLTGGYGATLCCRYREDARDRLAVAYVGEDGIEAGIPYRYGVVGKQWVRACARAETP